jgi:hypothetical protein
MTEAEIIARLAGLHDRIAADVPQIARGQVWCRTCGRSERVDGANCLRHGWPKCCGFTMTIDSPAEQRALAQGE